MKKYFLLPLLLFSPLFALPLGNPMDASLYTNSLFRNDCCYEDRNCNPCDPCFDWCDAWRFRVGFYGDYVFERHMELKSHGKHAIDHFELYTNAVYLALNVCDRLDIFATLGGTNFVLGGNVNVFIDEGLTGQFDLETESAFSWSIGGRFTLWSCECFHFGMEAQYFRTKPDVRLFSIPIGLQVYPDDTIDLKYSEWQVGLGASYLMRIGCSGISAIPYLGVKLSGSDARFDNARPFGGSDQLTLRDLNNNNLWGVAYGTTILFCDGFGITVEGRWGDEKAVHVNSQFSF